MSENGAFDGMAKGLKNPFVAMIAFFVFLGLFAIGCALFIEDYTTSLKGYEAWPTLKANPWVVYFVAALPQLAQIGLAYTAIDRRNGMALIATLLFWLWDLATDVYFKSAGFQSAELVGFATVESGMLYTLGSEILIAFSVGMLWHITKQQRAAPRVRYEARKQTPQTQSKPDWYNRFEKSNSNTRTSTNKSKYVPISRGKTKK